MAQTPQAVKSVSQALMPDSLGLENGNGGDQVSEIGAGLVKASLVFADCLADLIPFAAQCSHSAYLGHCAHSDIVLIGLWCTPQRERLMNSRFNDGDGNVL
jgi:hypothetical protein